MSSIQPELSLEDLVQPLSSAEFIEQHLLGGTHFISQPNPALIEALTSLDAFKNLRKLLARFDSVSLFGPNGFRSELPGSSAMDFYNRGDTVYVHNVQVQVPEAVQLFAGVATNLGIDESDLGIEVFAGRQHAISTLHYDHDTNFQILVRGAKRWRMQPNRHILNPLLPNHRLQSPPEEALAERLPMPTRLADLEDPVEVAAEAGTCLFFPIGYWHEVEAFEDCFAVNVVVKPPRWVDAIVGAVRQAVLTQPALRAPAFGAVGQHNGRLRQHALDELKAGLRAVATALEVVQPADVSWARVKTVLRWTPRCACRHLDETPQGLYLVCPDLSKTPFKIDRQLEPVMRKLIDFRGPFKVNHLAQFAPGMPIAALGAYVMYMKVLAYFEDEKSEKAS